MKWTLIKNEVADIIRKHHKRAKKHYGFLTGGVDLLACHEHGRLDELSGGVNWTGQDERPLNSFKKSDVMDCIEEAIRIAHENPNINPESLEVGFDGRYDGYESIHAYRNDEGADLYVEDIWIPVWSMKTGFKVIDYFEK